MNARLERNLRLLAVIIVVGTIAGLGVNFAQGRASYSSMAVGTAYGLMLCIVIGGVELFVLDGAICNSRPRAATDSRARRWHRRGRY
jgi:hypothetical protein|nr:hypothetical protein [Bradyrhizobium sp.]